MKHKFTFFAVVMMALAMPLHAQYYDFSAVAPSGQTLFYKVVEGGVAVRPVNPAGYGTFEKPSGVLTIPDSVSWNDSTYAVVGIGGYAFRGCDSLTSVHIPGTVTMIYGNAFGNCTSLTTISGGIAVDTISGMAFRNCSALTSFTMPESVVYIGQRAFSHCTGLTAVTIPEAVAFIGQYAFDSCTNLTTIYFNADSCDGLGPASGYAFGGCDNVNSLIIGDNVKIIPRYLFQGLQGLTSLVIPDAVTTIRPYAFSGLTNLQTLVIGSSVSQIQSCAFEQSPSLQQLTLKPQVPPTYSYHVFSYDHHTSNDSLIYNHVAVTVPCGSGEAYRAAEGWSNFINIYDPCRQYDFSAVAPSGQTLYYRILNDEDCCRDVNVVDPCEWWNGGSVEYYHGFQKPAGSLTIPDSVEYNGTRYRVTGMHWRAFATCDSLISVVLPNSMEVQYNGQVFMNCTSLESVSLPSSITRIPLEMFFGCYSLNAISLPEGVTDIDTGAFTNCSSLTNINIPSSVTHIGSWAFENCSNLVEIVLPEGLQKIEWSTFRSCHSLSSITLPSTLTYIGWYAFGGCSSLERIDLPQSLTALDEGAFWYCTALDSLVFPDHIRTLGRNLMDSCISLTYVHLPDSLEYADTSLLRFCTALRHVDLPQHINRIEGWALMQCHSLESLDVPEGVTSIGETALYNDFNLAKLRLPSTLRNLGNIAMAYCQSLDTVWVAATTPPTCTQNTFSYANGSATLVVPCGTAESYRSTQWSYFNIVEDCSTEGIGDIESSSAVIMIQDGAIVVEGVEGNTVSVYDINGRLLATAQGEHAPLQFNVPASGTYLVKVGDHPARRVVVVR